MPPDNYQRGTDRNEGSVGFPAFSGNLVWEVRMKNAWPGADHGKPAAGAWNVVGSFL
jgi:hypothetical protein